MNKTYGTNFNVAGFGNSGGVWTKVAGYATWTFTQATVAPAQSGETHHLQSNEPEFSN